MGKFSRRKHNAPAHKERTTYQEVVRENPQMEAYYKAQNIVSEEEWPIFWEHLKATLPTTFRITGTRRYRHCCYQNTSGNFATGKKTNITL
jgi:hypothetical protein